MNFKELKQRNSLYPKAWFHFWQTQPWAEEHVPCPEGYPHDEWRLYDKCHYWSMQEANFKLMGTMVKVRGVKYIFVDGERPTYALYVEKQDNY